MLFRTEEFDKILVVRESSKVEFEKKLAWLSQEFIFVDLQFSTNTAQQGVEYFALALLRKKK